MRKFSWLKYLAYPALFIVLTMFFVYLTLPINQLKDYAAYEIDAVLEEQGSPVEVTLGELSSWRLSGLQLKDVNVYARGPNERVVWKMKRIAFRKWLTSFISKGTGYSFSAQPDKGEAFGSVWLSSTGQLGSLSLNANKLPLDKIPLALLAGLPISGIASLTSDINNLEKQPKFAEGKLSLVVTDAVVGPGVIRGLFGFNGALTLPAIKLGKLEIEIKVIAGRIKSQKIVLSNGDIEASVNLEGDVNDNIMFSQINGDGWFKVSQNLSENNVEMGPLIEILVGRQNIGNKVGFKFRGTLRSPGAYLDGNMVPTPS